MKDLLEQIEQMLKTTLSSLVFCKAAIATLHGMTASLKANSELENNLKAFAVKFNLLRRRIENSS